MNTSKLYNLNNRRHHSQPKHQKKHKEAVYLKRPAYCNFDCKDRKEGCHISCETYKKRKDEFDAKVKDLISKGYNANIARSNKP